LLGKLHDIIKDGAWPSSLRNGSLKSKRNSTIAEAAANTARASRFNSQTRLTKASLPMV